MGLWAWSCSDSDDEPLNYGELPTTIQTWLSNYYPGIETTRVVKEGRGNNTEYDVYLSDGSKVEFDASGQWKDIEAPYGKSVPQGVVLTPIRDFVADTYPGMLIVEISRDSRYYDVDLSNGVDLIFDINGTFVRIDR